MNKRKAIKGFSALHVGELLKNTSTEYEVDAMVEVIGAQSATIERQGEDYEILADDSMYDEGTEFKRDQLEIQIAELPLGLHAKLDGATFDEQTGVYTWGPSAVAPEIALSFRAAMIGGGWRLIRYFRAKVSKIKVDFNTKGGGGEISSYMLTISATTRKVDDKLLDMKDIEDAADLGWLKDIPKIPSA